MNKHILGISDREFYVIDVLNGLRKTAAGSIHEQMGEFQWKLINGKC